jgi:O-antigen/teichoic acid export membrane protein
MAVFSPRDVARDYAYVSVARVISLVIGFFRSLVIPGLLGPLSYGIWKALGLIQTYAQFGDLGTRAALKREIPFYTGKGDMARVAAARDTAFAANNISILTAAACAIVGAFLVDDAAMRTALLLFLPGLYFAHMNSFFEQLLSALKEFTWMARLSVWSGVLEAALAIGFTWAFGVNGLIVGTALAYLISTAFQVQRIGWDVRPRWNWPVLRELISIGFPSHLNGLLYNIFISIDRWLILSFMGLTSFGYYALGMTINEYLLQFSYTFGNVLSPRLVEKYSERERVEDLRGMVEVPLIIISRFAPVALGGVYFVAEAVVRTFLTSFEPGLVPLQILLVGTFFSSVPRGLSSFFITLRKQSQTVHLYLMAIGLNLVLVWWLLSSGYGLAGAATGTSLSLAMFGLGMIVLAMRYFMSTGSVIMFLLRLFWPGAFALALVWLANQAGALLVGEAHGILNRLVSALIFLAGYSPVLFSLYRTYGDSLRPAREEIPAS